MSYIGGISFDFRDLVRKLKKIIIVFFIRFRFFCLEEGLKVKGWLEIGFGFWEDVDNFFLVEIFLLKF